MSMTEEKNIKFKYTMQETKINTSTFISYIPRSLAKGANTSKVSLAMAFYSQKK